jgi:hypothetical protein
MKFSFIILGAMKCGTTSLSEILRRHPEIEFCSREINFFSDSANWKANVSNYEKCITANDKKVYGESSTHYTYYPEFNLEIWNDIYAYNPDMKFIYMIRNPVDRAISQYMHIYERGYTDYSLDEAIKKVPSIINNGRYYTQIKPFADLFGKEKVLIIDFDDFTNNRSAVLRDVAAFLKVDFDKFQDISDVHANVTIGGGKWHHKFDGLKKRLNVFRGFFPVKFRNFIWDLITGRSGRAFSKKPELSPELRRVVINLTRLDILELERFTNKKLSKWLQ